MYGPLPLKPPGEFDPEVDGDPLCVGDADGAFGCVRVTATTATTAASASVATNATPFQIARPSVTESLGRHQLDRDVDRLDAGKDLNVAFDLVQHPPGVELCVGDHRDPDGRALMLILMVDLGDGRV